MVCYSLLHNCNRNKEHTHDIFLELGNREKYLYRGYVSNAPIVIARLAVKMGLTITKLLHDVDLVLGINLLQLVYIVVN